MNKIRHFTATTYILKEGRVLLMIHPKFKKWLPPGGHLEENELPHEGARREVLEETGLEIEFIVQENIWINAWNAKSIPRPYLCLLEEVPEHKGILAHEHIDCIYLAKSVAGKEKEEVCWFTLDQVLAMKKDEEIFGETQEVITHLFLAANKKIPRKEFDLKNNPCMRL